MIADIWPGLEQLSTAHLCDIMAEDGVWDRVLSPQLRPVLPFRKMVGTVVTARWIEAAGHDETALEQVCQHGLQVERPILVIECHGPHFAPVGSCVGGMLSTHGFGGAVVDGTLRDSNDLYEMDFQVYARLLFPQNQGRFRLEWCNEPVTVGGVIVEPGDIIFGDHDGLVALRGDDGKLRQYITKGEQILAFEQNLLSELRKRTGRD